MTSKITFVIGGCRSGKSRHALLLADGISGVHKYFIATCMPQDDEMRRRVARHQAERGDGWLAVETPVRLSEAIREIGPKAQVLLIDCLTLWVSNLMMEHADPDDVAVQADHLADSLRNAACPVFLVSNEVGEGIVPDNMLARQFRDAVGLVNQKIVAAADEVIWMVAGIPVKIKPAHGAPETG